MKFLIFSKKYLWKQKFWVFSCYLQSFECLSHEHKKIALLIFPKRLSKLQKLLELTALLHESLKNEMLVKKKRLKKNQWYIPVKITDFKGIPIEERAYICDSPQGMAGLQEFARNLIRWVINIALLLGVLWIACLGVAWIIAGDNDTEEKRKIKWWLTNLIVGLIILFFFQQILRFIAPWIYN